VFKSTTVIVNLQVPRYPPTQIREVIANNVEDTALLDGLLRQRQDTCVSVSTHLKEKK